MLENTNAAGLYVFKNEFFRPSLISHQCEGNSSPSAFYLSLTA